MIYKIDKNIKTDIIFVKYIVGEVVGKLSYHLYKGDKCQLYTNFNFINNYLIKSQYFSASVYNDKVYYKFFQYELFLDNEINDLHFFIGNETELKIYKRNIKIKKIINNR